MNQEKRKQPDGKQPIIRHPLFPATVALWFGALFGLGSLAIRPTLLESVVVSLGIDAVVPVMAPPLGATARMLLALSLAAIGGIIGAKLARTIAGTGRRKKRGDRLGSIFGAKQQPATQRRRQLAIEDRPARPSYGENAPVPGTSPKILDVAEFDLDGFEAEMAKDEVQDEPGPVRRFDAEAAPAGEEPVQAFTPEPAPSEAALGDAPACKEERSGLTADAGLAPEPDLGEFDEDVQWPGVRKPVAFEHAVDPAESPAEPVDENLPRFDLRNAFEGKPNSVFATAPVQPLFNRAQQTPRAEMPASDAPLAAAEPEEANPAPFAAPQQARPAVAEAVMPQAFQPEPVEPPAFLNDASRNEELPVPDAKEQFEPAALDNPAASRLMTADPEDLSHVELLERLALALKRRNDKAQETKPDAAAKPTEPVAAAPFAPAPQETQAATARPAELPAAAREPVEAELQAAAMHSEVPAALRPIGFDEEEDDDRLLSFVPPRRIGIASEAAEPVPDIDAAPAAEISPVEAEDDDEETLEEEQALEEGYSSLLSLSRSNTGQSSGFVRIEEPEPVGEIEPVVVFPGLGASDSAPFGKPLESPAPFAKPAERTVREPEVGQRSEHTAPADSNAPPPFAPPVEESQDKPAQPPFAPPADRQDPEETERALRSALANLQRMSGAA